jgi:hypothetical protein
MRPRRERVRRGAPIVLRRRQTVKSLLGVSVHDNERITQGPLLKRARSPMFELYWHNREPQLRMIMHKGTPLQSAASEALSSEWRLLETFADAPPQYRDEINRNGFCFYRDRSAGPEASAE